MKIVVILLSIAVLVLGVLYFQSAQRPPELRRYSSPISLVTAVAPQPMWATPRRNWRSKPSA